jgi:signal transduction histidine kinase
VTTPLPLLRPNRVERTLIRRQTEQEALVALSRAALGSIDVASLLQMAVERVAWVSGVELVSIIERIGEDEGLVRANVGDPSVRPGFTKASLQTGSPARYSIDRESTTLVENLADDPRFDPGLRLIELGMQSGVNVVIPSRRGGWGTLGIWTKHAHRITQEDAQFAEVIACWVGWVISRHEVETRLAEAVQEKDRGLRLEMALSRCAQVLLGDYDPAAVEVSLRALMEATNASFGYIDWHALADRSVPSVRLSRDGRSESLDQHWERVSWDDLPTLQRSLQRGEGIVVRVAELPSEEAATFLTAPELVMSELDIPIMINGVWTGTIGLGDRDMNRIWDSKETAAITHAASMFSSWWEKRDYSIRLEEAVESRNRQVRLEQSVAAAAQLLSQSSEAGDLDRALKLLLYGAQTTSVFVERNTTNNDGELCSRVISVAQSPDSVYDPYYWDMMPWSKMPDTYDLLSKGDVAVLIPDQMDGTEADTYAATPVKSEVDVPIMVDGIWHGLIGMADEDSARDWGDEIQMLHTAAEMIASFWRRIDSARRLEELAHSKDEFIASISHELRTPLTAVVGLAETLVGPNSADLPEETREFMKIIAEQSAEMAAIVQDLLVVARTDIGRVSIRPETIDLVAETHTASRGVRWESRTPPEITGRATALADPFRVRQVIRNLLTNAVRYGGQNVKISLAETEGWARVRVMDDGPGIPTDDRERIFRPYERAHHRLGQPASVGLGLTVSRQLAILMGGSLEYDVRDGWSTFELKLPGSTLEEPDDVALLVDVDP